MKKMILLMFLAMSLKAIAQTTPPVPPTPPTPPTPPSTSSGQRPEPPRKEKVESMRIAFLTQKLDLSTEEAQRFWPVYNEFQKKRDELHKKKREARKGVKENLDSLSDKQIEALVDLEMATRQKNLDLEKEYYGKFKSVLPIKKVAKFYRAEEQFTHRLLDEISDRGKRGGGHGGHKSPKAPRPIPPGEGDN